MNTARRYQHKVCSLVTCPRQGEYGCMHCTCDGSCNLGHTRGQCGSMREGSGPQCNDPTCSHDQSCTHSRRAVCYTCRRHRVSKFVRSSKRYHNQAIVTHSIHHPRQERLGTLPGIHMLGTIKYNDEFQSLKIQWLRRKADRGLELEPRPVQFARTMITTKSAWRSSFI